MKRHLSILACLVMLIAVVLTIASCKPEEPEHVHAYTEVETKAPTCTEKGEKTFTCSCNDSYTEEIKAKGHVEVAVPAVAPTCEKDGLGEGAKCSVCNAVTKEQPVVKALGHKPGAAATCTTAQVCTNEGCDKVYVAALGHSHTAVVTAPTCEAAGYTTYTCVCGDNYTADEVAATGHSYASVVTAPTCEAAGYTTYTCSACSNSYTADEVAALGHDYDEVVTNATCTEAGSKVYTCKNDASHTYTEVIPAGHTLAEGSIICSVCEKIIVKTTDTYCWNDLYSITAPNAGTYTLKLPAGLGLISKDRFDTWPPVAPELDYQLQPDGGEISTELAAGETFEFYVGATTKATWEIEWSYSETTQGGGSEGGDDPVISEETALNIGANSINGANVTFAYTASVDGTLTLSAGNAVMGPVSISYAVNGGDFTVLELGNTVAVDLAAGDKIVIAVEATGYSSINAEWAGQSAGSDVTDLTIGNNAINGADITYGYTASEDGTLTLTAGGAAMGMVEISYVVNDGESVVLELSTTATLTLVAGDKVVITVVAEGYSTITAGWESNSGEGGGENVGDGSEENPYVQDSFPESVVVDYSVISGKVYYIFTAQATGTVTFTWPNAGDSWYGITELDAYGYNTENSTSGFMTDSFSFDVVEGTDYLVWLGSWSEAGSHTITIAIGDGSEGGDPVEPECQHEYEQNTFYHQELVAATCTTPGVAVFECIYCDDYYTEVTPIDSEAHSFWGDEEIVTAANCATETNGLKKVACANGCGQYEEQTIYYESSHDWDVQKDVQATCTEDGGYYAVCTICGLVEEYSSEAQGHYNWYLTCGQTGTCMAEGCGVEFTLQHTVDPCVGGYCVNCWSTVAGAHSMTEVPAKDATCTEAGNNAYWTCGTCGGVYADEAGETMTTVEDETIAALGHNYVEYVCSVCGKDDPDHYFVMSISDALAAVDGKKVEVSGTVCAINTAWSDSYGNISVTITDADGSELYIYRLKTNVALGDIITVKGAMATYNEDRQIAAGATAEITGHDTSYDYVEMSIVDALAAADNTNVIVTGTVVTINTAYSSSYNNISVTIADDNGTQLYIYRLAGGSDLAVGDIITIKGAMATYSGSRQIAGGTYTEVGVHTCSNYTNATCLALAACVVCGTTTGELADHNYVDGVCSVCNHTEGAAEVEPITASKNVSDLITEYGWTSSTTKQTFALDDVVSVKINGGSNTGKAYEGNHIRIYATDSPAGTITISVAAGYELVSIKITTVTGTYAYLYVDGTTTDICNTTTAVSGSSVVLNSVKNGSNGKQVRVTAFEVVYKAVG